MIEPPAPVDELLRLEQLRKLKILDTDPDERFDRVTRLARRIFGTPIALVSLVDSDRQWFKSRQGLEACETPRDISFCGHAILEDEVMIVNDAQRDERFCDNPLVTSDPNIRFYAGYPLKAPDGSKVGTLCVIDRSPRELDDDDVRMLEELGRMVEEEFVVAEMMRDDPVTGLSNREGFRLIADHLLPMCERTGAPASLVLVHFTNHGTILDSVGDDQADRAAVEMAQILMASFRESDIVARLSSDVFGVLLAGSGVGGIDIACERLHRRIGLHNEDPAAGYEIESERAHGLFQPGIHLGIDDLIRDVIDSMQCTDDSIIVEEYFTEAQFESA